MASFANIRKAIAAAIAAASGLPASSVIWKFQNYNAPAVDYIAISLSALTTVGQDSILQSFDAGRDAGQEFAEQILGVREVALQLEVFSASVASSTTPTVDAEERAEQTRSKLLLPTIRNALFMVGFVPFDPGPVQYAPEIVNVGFRGRASCDIRSRMPAQAFAEYIGYMAGVHGTITVDPNGIVIPFKAPAQDLYLAFEYDGPDGLGLDDGIFEE